MDSDTHTANKSDKSKRINSDSPEAEYFWGVVYFCLNVGLWLMVFIFGFACIVALFASIQH